MFCFHFQYKEISPVKCFWKPWISFLCLNFQGKRKTKWITIYPSNDTTVMTDLILAKPFLFLEIQVRRTNSRFSKTFFRGISIVEYLCNRSTKMRTKNFNNCISIWTNANHRNWQDALYPLISTQLTYLTSMGCAFSKRFYNLHSPSCVC